MEDENAFVFFLKAEHLNAEIHEGLEHDQKYLIWGKNQGIEFKGRLARYISEMGIRVGDKIQLAIKVKKDWQTDRHYLYWSKRQIINLIERGYMGFIIERYFGFDARFHPMCWGELWDKKAKEYFEGQAIEKCKELAEKEKGKYRVRSMKDSSIPFEIKTA